jgi:hypothetical protein
MSTAAMSHILTEEMLSWRTVVKNGRRSNILRLQAFLFWFFSIGCAIPSPMGKLYTRAGRSRHNAVCHSGGAENNNNLY